MCEVPELTLTMRMWSAADPCNMCTPAITDPALCTNVGGIWKHPQCSVTSQLQCNQHGGQWRSEKQWTLKGGVDLLIVGLLQVKAYQYVCVSSTMRECIAGSEESDLGSG